MITQVHSFGKKYNCLNRKTDVLANFKLVFSYAGFKPLFQWECASDSQKPVSFNNAVQLDAFLSPLALLLCYYTLAVCSQIDVRVIFKKKKIIKYIIYVYFQF